VHLGANVDREGSVLADLSALIPRQRFPQMLGESIDRVRQRNLDVLWFVALGDLEQHHLSGAAFHQGPDC
jgi:hypothetical protein